MIEKLLEQHQRIAELEEQLKNAIVPKFKIGQKVFYIEDTSSEIVIDEIQLRRDKFYYMDYRYGEYFEDNELFAPKEEAAKRLKELKGEK